MPPASRSAGTTAADPILAAEREHLRRSRDFLELMRTDVLSLRAMGGDPVSEEYLKADLYRRAEALRGPARHAAVLRPARLPAGRAAAAADRRASGGRAAGPTSPDSEHFHVGRRHVHDPHGTPVVIDWRAPVSRPFYRASQAEPMGLDRRRRFGFAGGELTAFEDEQFAPRCRRGGPGRRRRRAPAGS